MMEWGQSVLAMVLLERLKLCSVEQGEVVVWCGRWRLAPGVVLAGSARCLCAHVRYVAWNLEGKY